MHAHQVMYLINIFKATCKVILAPIEYPTRTTFSEVTLGTNIFFFGLWKIASSHHMCLVNFLHYWWIHVYITYFWWSFENLESPQGMESTWTIMSCCSYLFLILNILCTKRPVLWSSRISEVKRPAKPVLIILCCCFFFPNLDVVRVSIATCSATKTSAEKTEKQKHKRNRSRLGQQMFYTTRRFKYIWQHWTSAESKLTLHDLQDWVLFLKFYRCSTLWSYKSDEAQNLNLLLYFYEILETHWWEMARSLFFAPFSGWREWELFTLFKNCLTACITGRGFSRCTACPEFGISTFAGLPFILVL